MVLHAEQDEDQCQQDSGEERQEDGRAAVLRRALRPRGTVKMLWTTAVQLRPHQVEQSWLDTALTDAWHPHPGRAEVGADALCDNTGQVSRLGRGLHRAAPGPVTSVVQVL